MPSLRLHRDDDQDLQRSLPFPNRYRQDPSDRVGRIGAGYAAGSEDPFRIDSIRNVERALSAVESNFARLKNTFNESDDSDRPRAA